MGIRKVISRENEVRVSLKKWTQNGTYIYKIFWDGRWENFIRLKSQLICYISMYHTLLMVIFWEHTFGICQYIVKILRRLTLLKHLANFVVSKEMASIFHATVHVTFTKLQIFRVKQSTACDNLPFTTIVSLFF